MLSNEVHDVPPPVPLLDMTERERRALGTPQPAAEEHRQDRAVAQSFDDAGIRRIQQRLCPLDGEPVRLLGYLRWTPGSLDL
jgi:hypothetical protein